RRFGRHDMAPSLSLRWWDHLRGLETRQFARRRLSKQIPQPFVLNVQHEMEARQLRDDVAVLLVEMREGGIVAEDVHPLPLRENHTDRAVLEDQAGFSLQKDAHLLIDHEGFFPSRAERL